MLKGIFNLLLRFISMFALIIFLSLSLLFVLDYFDVYNNPIRTYVPASFAKKFYKEDYIYSNQEDDSLGLEELKYQKKLELVELENQNLKSLRTTLEEEKQKIALLESELLQKQKELDEKQKNLDEITKRYEDEQKTLEQSAKYLMNMPPESVVANLDKLEDEVVIAHLRKVEELSLASNQASVVPYWLSLMNAEKASTILRKMSLSLLN